MGKAPSGNLLVFLVLPEGEKNFIRSPVEDLKSFIAWRVWCGSDPARIQEGLRKKKFKLFFVASKNSTARSSGCGGLLRNSKSPHGQGASFEPLHKTKPPAGPSPGRRKGVSWAKRSGIHKVFLVLPGSKNLFDLL